MSHGIDQVGQDVLFYQGRTYSRFLDKPVAEDTLRKAWDLARMGPTAANGLPMRVVFLRSAKARERLLTALAPNNVEKTIAAPVTAILAYDLDFFERLPELYPHADARSWYSGNAALAAETAFRNGSLQAGYFILALRAVGLDAGPMSGFDNAKVDEEFFAGTRLRSNLLVNIGYGDVSALRPRGPRLSFEEGCTLL